MDDTQESKKLPFKILNTPTDAFQYTAQQISRIVEASLFESKVCNVIVAAGHAITQSLSYLPPADLDWSRVNWFLADERCVDQDNEFRNDLQIRNILQKTLVGKYVNVISTNPRIPIAEAVLAYASRVNVVDMFDFCLLGMGDDGHVASLFPGELRLSSSDTCVYVANAPKLPTQRITLGMTALRRTKNRLIIATGGSKVTAMNFARENPTAPLRVFDPTLIITDRSAYS